VDFLGFERRLVVELDGGHHGEKATTERDRERAAWLKERGHEVMRFWNNEAQRNVEGALENISEALTWG
jgi:very-short-patch-repair endonuclease